MLKSIVAESYHDRPKVAKKRHQMSFLTYPFPETQPTDDWFKNANQSTISNSHPLPLTTNETTISGMSDFKSIIPPPPRSLKLS